MLKKILCLLLALLLSFSLAVAVFAAEGSPAAESQTETEMEVSSEPVASFYVNGRPVYGAELYTVEGVTYVPVATFLNAALAESTVSAADGQLVITGTTASGDSLTVTARFGDCYIVANGRYLYVENEICCYNGWTMAPIVVLASIFNGTAFWGYNNDCYAVLGDSLLTSGDQFYDAEQLDLLSHLIYSESGNQPLAGKIAVGNVILNRVEDARFPSTLYDVIYAKNQFCVVRNGTINLEPNDESIVAAKLTLEGVRLTNALYFNRKGMNSWASRNCTYVSTIGNHDFYA